MSITLYRCLENSCKCLRGHRSQAYEYQTIESYHKISSTHECDWYENSKYSRYCHIPSNHTHFSREFTEGNTCQGEHFSRSPKAHQTYKHTYTLHSVLYTRTHSAHIHQVHVELIDYRNVANDMLGGDVRLQSAPYRSMRHVCSIGQCHQLLLVLPVNCGDCMEVSARGMQTPSINM